ncbi:hypothetical protein KCU81_g1336, partial [Aureobasidium melanogenum]
MISRKSSSTTRVTTPRTTISNPDASLNYIEELLYHSKQPDTTSDLKRPRASSESTLVEDESNTRPSTDSKKHTYGQPCPENNEHCHYHHQLTQYCHIPWRNCSSALNAIKQSYRTGGQWIGAPKGWNETHNSCLKTDKKCDAHAQLHDIVLEKQKNKKYPGKPRARGRHSRGSGSLGKKGKE